MQKFPRLINHQVALMRADVMKGYILDENFIFATTDNQSVFTVMNSLEEALELANQILSERNDVECIIYGKDKAVLSFLRPKELNEK